MTISQAATLRIITDIFEWTPPEDISVTVGGRTSGGKEVKAVLMRNECGCMAIVAIKSLDAYSRSAMHRMLEGAVQEIRDRHRDDATGFAKHTTPHRN